MDLSIDFDAPIPKSKRSGGSGREGEKWEDHLAPLKANAGKSARVFTFEDEVREGGKTITSKAKAATKVSLIGNRLRKVAPKEEWKFNIRPLNDEETQHGLWITYVREMNDDEFKAYEVKRAERTAKIQATRAKNAAAEVNGAPAEAPATSPADQVAAARAAKGGNKAATA